MEATAGHDAGRLNRDDTADAPEARTPSDGRIFERMRREGYRFDFYHAVRLLEQRAQKRVQSGTNPRKRTDPVHFRASSSLSFPASDVKHIDVPDDAGEPATVVSTFMGLYGVDAPLPMYFYENIAVDESAHASLRDFLDIFAHRFYEMFYLAWKRVRPELDDEGSHRRRLMALSGLAHGTETPVTAELMPLAGRLAPRARGAEGLAGMLRLLLDLPVRIEQFVPRWVRVARTGGIGRGARLAGSSMLGERVYDASGKFRVWVGPMDLDRYLALLPGGIDSQRMSWAIRAFVPGFLDFDAALQLRTETLPRLRLSDRQCRLGLTAALGSPSTAIMTRVVHAS